MKKYKAVFTLFVILISFIGCKDSSDIKPDELHYENNHITRLLSLNYLNDEYYLFFQESQNSGRKLGLLRSKNGVKWNNVELTNQPDSLYRNGCCCIVNDFMNSSGLSEQKDLMLLFNLEQDKIKISYSEDLGVNWTSKKDSIVIKNSYKDILNMKIVRDEAEDMWIMLLVRNFSVDFFKSPDLLNWEYCSSFSKNRIDRGGNWNTIDFYPVKIAESSELKWSLVIGNTQGAPNYGYGAQYFVGDFKNFKFETNEDVKWLDAGTDFFYPIVMSDYLQKGLSPTMIARVDYSNKLSLLRTFDIKYKFGEYHFESSPVYNSDHFEMNLNRIPPGVINGNIEIEKTFKLPVEIVLNFNMVNRKYLDFAKSFGLILDNEQGDKIVVGYHNYNRYFYIFNNDEIFYAPAVLDNDEVNFRVVIDKDCIEFYSANGLTSMVKLYKTSSPLTRYSVFSEDGTMTLKNGSISDFK